MKIRPHDTAIVITDPQNHFLSPSGATWGVVGESVQKNKTVEHIERLFKGAKANGYDVFVSPHSCYLTDRGWKLGGTVGKIMRELEMFYGDGDLAVKEFSGAELDWLERFKPYIEDGKTIITAPHKMDGPETNDLALQLRKHGKSNVLLAGMSANLCVEAHLRALLEQGFEVTVIKDAVAAMAHPDLGDGYNSAITNFGFLASAVRYTVNIVKDMEAGLTKKVA
jgi:nicotinamidase-related amidase